MAVNKQPPTSLSPVRSAGRFSGSQSFAPQKRQCALGKQSVNFLHLRQLGMGRDALYTDWVRDAM
jgi:hypothetical protein